MASPTNQRRRRLSSLSYQFKTIDLLVACTKKHYTEAAELLKAGADPNAECTSLGIRNSASYFTRGSVSYGTSLHFACQDGSLEFVKLLVKQFNADTEILACKKVCCQCEHRERRGRDHDRYYITQSRRDPLYYHTKPKEWIDDGPYYTPLQVACVYGHTAVVEYLIDEQECNKKATDSENNTLLHLACDEGHLDLVKFLTSRIKRDQLNSTNTSGYTPLQLACLKNHLDIVSFLVTEMDCDPDIQNKQDGNTALHLACMEGYLDAVKILYAAKCKLDLTNKDRLAAINLACENNRVEIVNFLATKFNAKRKPSIFDCALHFACSNGHLDIVTVLITETNCNPDVPDKNGNTALHLACKHPHLEVVSYLIAEANCDFNLFDSDGNTALHSACVNGHLNLVIVLVTGAKCNPKIPNKSGNNLLHIACSKGYMDILKFLIADGNCNPAQPNEDGSTALHLACNNGHLDIASYLVLDQQCVPNATNKNGCMPFHLACQNGHLKIAQFLVNVDSSNYNVNLTNNTGNTALHMACENGHLGVAIFLVDKLKSDVNQLNNDGNTPLHLACTKAHYFVVRLLVMRLKCKTNLSNRYGHTALHLACTTGDEKIVETLVMYGDCNPDFADNDGNTALHIACQRKFYKLVEFLVTNSKQNCNTNVINKEGTIPLHLACQQGHVPAVKLLLEQGKSDPNIRNNSGYAPSELSSDPDITVELIRHGANTADIYKAYGKGKGMKKPLQTPIKVFVVGNPSAGKSTLTAALQKEISYFKRALGTSKKVSGVNERTAGVIPHDFESKNWGHITLYDFAGQREFYSSHAALLQNAIQSSPPIFLLVTDLSKSYDEIRSTILYWLSFLKNQCTGVNLNKPHVIVVGSHLDIVRSQSEDPKKKLEAVLPLLTNNEFCFNGLVSMDCQFYQSKGMTELRQCIQKSCDVLRTQKTSTIGFNSHCFFVYLIDNFRDSVAVQLHQIQDKITKRRDEKLTFLPHSLKHLCSICEELNDRGHMLFLKDSTSEEDSWIIIDKVSLLSKVTGTIFAPKEFKEHCQLSTSTGVVSLAKIAKQFPDYNPVMLIGFLTHMEFCHEIYDQEIIKMIEEFTQGHSEEQKDLTSPNNRHFLFPGLISLNTPDHVWEQKRNYNFTCGWIMQASGMEDFFTTQFLHVLILRLAFTFAFPHKDKSSHSDHPAIHRKCSIWKNGIYWGNRDGVETLVEVLDHNKTVNVLIRSEEITPACLQLRCKVVKKVLEVSETLCSSVVTVESFIDPYETECHPLLPTSKLDLFNLTEVAESVVNGKQSVVSKNGQPISISSLLSYEPYAELGGSLLHELFDERRSKKKMDDRFLSQITKRIFKQKSMIKLFQQTSASHLPQEDSDDEHTVLEKWRDSCEGTYQSMRDKLNQVSVFGARNPFVLANTPIQPPLLAEDSTEDLGKLSVNDLRTVQADIWDARLQWYSIGIQLNMTVSSLDVIQEENHDSVEKCFIEMLKQWLKTKPVWSEMVDALRSPVVNQEVLADQICALHVKPTLELYVP